MGVYTTNSAEACYYCAENSRANIVVVEDQKQLDKILEIRSRLPNLKAVVQYSGEPTHPDVISVRKIILYQKTIPFFKKKLQYRTHLYYLSCAFRIYLKRLSIFLVEKTDGNRCCGI